MSALFNPDWYVDRLADLGMRVPAGVDPFFHWLTVGWDRRIVPTPLFDEQFYRQRHPHLADYPHWLFNHFLTQGCYQAALIPSPTGRHAPFLPDPGAREARRPVLLTEMLVEREAYDLTRTSWLEAGAEVALERYERFLGSPRVQQLVEKVAAIEPLIREPRRDRMTVSVAPYRQNRVYLYHQAEAVRRALARTTIDTVVIVPGEAAGRPERTARRFVELLRTRYPDETILAVAVDPDSGEGWTGLDGATVSLDLREYSTAMTVSLRVDLLLDVVRGLQAHRVITLGSTIGLELYRAYVRQISAWASVGAVAFSDAPEADVHIAHLVEECFSRLDWIALDDPATRERLVERFSLPKVSQSRLIGYASGDATGLAEVLDIPRRPA